MNDDLNIRLDDTDMAKLADWMSYEVTQAESNRETRRIKWDAWDKLYESQTDSETKDFPWKNASNIFIPLTRIHTDMVFSRLYKSMFSEENLWVVQADKNEKFADHAKPMQTFLNWMAFSKMNIKQVMKSALKEMARLGTTVIKGYYKQQARPRIDENGKLTPRMVNKCCVEHVRLQDFLVPDPHLEIEDQRWVAEEVRYTWSMLNELAYVGALDRADVDDLEQYLRTHTPDYMIEQESLHKYNRIEPYVIPIMQIHARLDINGDGLAEDVIIWQEKNSSKILRLAYAHPYCWRPYIAMRYIQRDGWFYGIGIPEMGEHIQKEINTMHNQRRDNATIANIRCVAARDGAVLNYNADTGVYPGFWIWTSDPKEDIAPFQLGDIYPSTFTEENMALQYFERLTGVTDPSLGRLGSGMGTRTPASLGISLMQQSASRMEMGVEDAKEALSELGYRIIEMSQIHKDHGIRDRARDVLSPEDFEKVNEIFDLSTEDLRERFALDLSVVGQVINRDVERQAHITLFQFIMPVYDRIFQYAQVFANPQIPPIIKQTIEFIVKDLDKRLKRIQNLFDQKDATAFASLLEENIDNLQPQPINPGALQGGPPGQIPGSIAGGLPGGPAGEGQLQGPRIPGAANGAGVPQY